MLATSYGLRSPSRASSSSPAGRGRAGPDEDLGEVERASTGRTAITAAVLEEDVASSRRDGGAAEIHDALESGATAAVTLLRSDLIEFEPGRVAHRTGRGCAGARTRRVAIAGGDSDLNEKLAKLGLDMAARWPVGAAAERWPVAHAGSSAHDPRVSSCQPPCNEPPDFTASGRATSHLGPRHRAASGMWIAAPTTSLGPAPGAPV